MVRTLSCGAVLLFAGLPFATARDACAPVLITSVPLQVDAVGNVLMPATVEGHEVYFSLQIGSGLPAVLESSVRSLGLKSEPMRGTAELTTGSGARISRFVKLDDVKVGGFKLLARAAPMVPQASEEEEPFTFDGRVVLGIMGSTLLRNLDAEINLSAGELKLFQVFECRDRSPVYWGVEAAELPMRIDEAGTLIFTMELDGRKIEASLMTGDRMSSVDANATRRFFGFDETSPGVESARNAAGREVDVFHAMSLTGAGIGIQDARVRLRTGSSCQLSKGTPGSSGAIGYSRCLNRAPFSLGTDLLSQLRIYISRKREKVYITRLATAAASDAGTVFIDR